MRLPLCLQASRAWSCCSSNRNHQQPPKQHSWQQSRSNNFLDQSLSLDKAESCRETIVSFASLPKSFSGVRYTGRNTCFQSACKKVASCTSLKDYTSKWIVQNFVVLFYHGMY